MIIAAASSSSSYADGDPYATDSQYRDAEPTTDPYGSDYGTGSYSGYDSDSGRYTVTIQVTGYGSQSDDGYEYMTGETGTGYGAVSTDSYRYGDSQETMAGAGSLDYVIDVLDGAVEMASGDSFYYT